MHLNSAAAAFDKQKEVLAETEALLKLVIVMSCQLKKAYCCVIILFLISEINICISEKWN